MGLAVGEVVTTTDFGFNISRSYTLTKQLNTPEPVRTGWTVSFTIRITNTGNAWISYLPLTDTYSNTHLTYGFASPQSNDQNDDGVLDWSDLTQTAPNGFGADLAPGASFAITVTFTAREDTSALPGGVVTNTATVHDAYVDPDGPGPLAGTPLADLPRQSANDGVEILRATGISVTSFKVTAAGRNVRVAWQTASETGIAGFNILRRANDGKERKVNGELIFAAHSGANQGAAYQYTEADVPVGVHSYVLEVIGLDGRSRRLDEIEVQVGQ